MIENSPGNLEDLCETCRLLYDKGLICSSGGNVSIRIGGDIYITPTGGTLWRLRPEDMVRVRTSDGQVLGTGQPSKETGFHLAMYRSHPDCNAVVHVHPTMTIAFSARYPVPGPDAIPPTNAGFYVRAGKIPLLPYFPSGSQELHRVVTGLAEDYTTIVLGNHGVIVARANLLEALNATEEIEQNSEIYLLVGRDGHYLTPAQCAAIDEKLGRSWLGADKHTKTFEYLRSMVATEFVPV